MPATALGKPVTPLLQPARPLAQGLVGAWPMADGGGLTLADASGRGNAGTLSGGVTWTGGPWGRCLSFDGSSGYVSVPNTGYWDFAGDFTLACWAQWRATPPSFWWQTALIGHDSGGGPFNKWIWSYDPTAFVLGATVLHFNGSSGLTGYGNPWAVTLGVWYHLALTRAGSLFTTYRQGIPDGTFTSVAAVPVSTVPLTIGTAEGTPNFPGMIDAPLIWNRALSSADVAALYADTFTMFRRRRVLKAGAAATGGLLLRRRREVLCAA